MSTYAEPLYQVLGGTCHKCACLKSHVLKPGLIWTAVF